MLRDGNMALAIQVEYKKLRADWMQLRQALEDAESVSAELASLLRHLMANDKYVTEKVFAKLVHNMPQNAGVAASAGRQAPHGGVSTGASAALQDAHD